MPLTDFQEQILYLLSVNRPHTEIGCLYYSFQMEKFINPLELNLSEQTEVVCHYGCPGGIIPKID